MNNAANSANATVSNHLLPLRDIYLPAEPSMWPLSTAVWSVLAIGLLSLLIVAWLGYYRLRPYCAKRAAQKHCNQQMADLEERVQHQLNQLWQQYQSSELTAHQWIAQSQQIVRRLAQHYLSARGVTDLPMWWDFLTRNILVLRDTNSVSLDKLEVETDTPNADKQNTNPPNADPVNATTRLSILSVDWENYQKILQAGLFNPHYSANLAQLTPCYQLYLDLAQHLCQCIAKNAELKIATDMAGHKNSQRGYHVA